MPYANINYTISSLDLAAINSSLATLRSKMPFLISLTRQDLKQFRKMGGDTVAFVNKTVAQLETNTALQIQGIDLSGIKRDRDLEKALQGIEGQLAQLHQGVTHTRLALREEMTRQGLIHYKVVGSLSKSNIPGMLALWEELKMFFKKHGRRKK